MKKILGVIQEHMFTNADIRSLEQGLRRIYRERYDDKSKVTVLWMVMPKGFAYAERKPSNAAILMIEADEDISQTKREELMGHFSSFLLENFSISPLDSVITVANSSFVNQFFDAQKKRIKSSRRVAMNLRILWQAFKSKWTNGYLKLLVRA